MILNTELSALLTVLNVFVYNVHLNHLENTKSGQNHKVAEENKKRKLKEKVKIKKSTGEGMITLST